MQRGLGSIANLLTRCVFSEHLAVFGKMAFEPYGGAILESRIVILERLKLLLTNSYHEFATRVREKGLRGSKVKLLLGGAFGAAGEVESCRGIFGFEEELFYGAEELGGFFVKARGQEKAEDPGVVVAEVNLGAVGKFDVEEMTEVGAEIFERRIAGEEDSPAFGPSLLDERFEESRFLRDADEVWREVRELRALRAFVERLIFLF